MYNTLCISYIIHHIYTYISIYIIISIFLIFKLLFLQVYCKTFKYSKVFYNKKKKMRNTATNHTKYTHALQVRVCT